MVKCTHSEGLKIARLLTIPYPSKTEQSPNVGQYEAIGNVLV